MQQQSAFQRRKNFFERKRFLNYQAHNPMDFQNKPLKSLEGGRAPSHSPQQENSPYEAPPYEQAPSSQKQRKGNPAAPAHDRAQEAKRETTMHIEDGQ